MLVGVAAQPTQPGPALACQLRNALPSQWVVENYCGNGTPNDVDAAGGPDSLNAVALFLATLPPER